MENIYLKRYLVPRDWCSDYISFKSYFTKYAEELDVLHNCVSGRKGSAKNVINLAKQLVPQASNYTDEEVDSLLDGINPEMFTRVSESLFLPATVKEAQGPSTSCIDTDSCPENKGFKKVVNRIEAGTIYSRRSEIVMNPSPTIGRKNLSPKKNFIVCFRIHAPFEYKSVIKNKPSRPGACFQEIWMLGQQRLVDLKDEILCESDFQDVRGDISKQPDKPMLHNAKDIFKSSMFYFGNTFYVDKRQHDNVDYSEPVREWGKANNVQFGDTLAMEDIRVDELQLIRMGYPYLFVHQGSCEHLVIISDARLLTEKDSLNSKDYPLLTRFTKRNTIYCMTCSRFPAKWIVRDCPRLVHDPTFQCKACFKMFHYIDGKKVGKFRAYLFKQRKDIT